MTLWRLRTTFAQHYRPMGALAVASLLAGLAEAAILALLAAVASALVAGASHANVHAGPLDISASLATLLLAAFLLALARLGLQALVAVLPASIAAGVQSRLRNGLFSAFTHASWEIQSRDREGHLQDMLTAQVIQAARGALQMATLVATTATALMLIVAAMVINPLVAVVVLAFALLVMAVLRPLNRLGHRAARDLSQAQLDYAGGIGEAVRLAEETNTYGTGEAQRSRAAALVDAARSQFFRTQLLGNLIPNLYQGLIFMMIIAGLAGLYVTGASDVASLGAVVLILVRAGSYGQQMQGAYQFTRQALPFLERLRDAEQRYLESRRDTGTRLLDSVSVLTLDRVSYSYMAGRSALTEVSLEVERGETIGISGPSGAGKSTLVQILLRLREPTQGRYLVNEVEATEYSASDWLRCFAYLPQEPRLLHATVADNIRFWREVDDREIERAARLAGIHDEIVRWEAGYETVVGPRADAVSGGQKQRICLARALALRPGVLILDEPTSAVDPHSERVIQESLAALGDELTMFVVAHRASTLDICDRIVVISDGAVAAVGSPPELREHSGYYRSAVAGASRVGVPQEEATRGGH